MGTSAYRPSARSEDLVSERAGDELLVYDLKRNRAHRLNSEAVTVFHACDGTRTPAQIAEQSVIDEEAVMVGIARLHECDLLEGGQADLNVISRRAMLRRGAVVAAGAAVAVPVIASITAPTPAQAQSGQHGGGGGDDDGDDDSNENDQGNQGNGGNGGESESKKHKGE